MLRLTEKPEHDAKTWVNTSVSPVPPSSGVHVGDHEPRPAALLLAGKQSGDQPSGAGRPTAQARGVSAYPVHADVPLLGVRPSGEAEVHRAGVHPQVASPVSRTLPILRHGVRKFSPSMTTYCDRSLLFQRFPTWSSGTPGQSKSLLSPSSQSVREQKCALSWQRAGGNQKREPARDPRGPAWELGSDPPQNDPAVDELGTGREQTRGLSPKRLGWETLAYFYT